MTRRDTNCPQCGTPLDPDATETASCPQCGRSTSDATVLPEQRDKKTRRPGQSVLVGGLAVMVIGIAAVVSYPMLREELERARMAAATRAAKNHPAASPAPRATGAEDPSERCELKVFRDQPGGETIVVLTEPGKMTEFRPNYYGSRSRLTRELVRQAVLMAAREGMNLPVRDAVIGDPAPAGQPAEVIEVDAQSLGHEVHLLVRRGVGEKKEVLLEKKLRDGESNIGNYTMLAEALEPLIVDGLPAVLGKTGLAGKPAPKQGDDRLPDGVEERLGRMAFAEQFAALRPLHAALRSDGPSPRRLAALSAPTPISAC